MEKFYLAIDLGVAFGRHILGHYDGDKMVLEEVYRFDNRMIENHGCLQLDLKRLYDEIINGLRKCKELGKIPVSMGIDSCGVDFVLLNDKNQVISGAAADWDYLSMENKLKVRNIFEAEGHKEKEGLESGAYNTVYQLLSLKQKNPRIFEQAKSFLLLPNYIHFLLTGNKKNEYTLATTTNLVDTKEKDWNYPLIEKLGLPTELFEPIGMPGEYVGTLLPQIATKVGFRCEVIHPGCLSAASAAVAVSWQEEAALYIGMDNWSLVQKTKRKSLENHQNKEENKVDNHIEYQFMRKGALLNPKRHIKNWMGTWVMQNVKEELASQYSFEKLANFAKDYMEYEGRIDLLDERFLSQRDVINQIQYYLKEHNSTMCQSIGELVACVYLSLAENYGKSIQEIEQMTGKTYDVIHIMNGSYNAELLNELTAEYTGKRVSAVPQEATALGNLSVQMIASGEFSSLEEARKSILETYESEEKLIKS